MSDVQVLEEDTGPPAPVFIALGASYALAATLFVFGAEPARGARHEQQFEQLLVGPVQAAVHHHPFRQARGQAQALWHRYRRAFDQVRALADGDPAAAGDAEHRQRVATRGGNRGRQGGPGANQVAQRDVERDLPHRAGHDRDLGGHAGEGFAIRVPRQVRRDEVEKTQHSADVSLVWFEHVRRFWDMDPTRFAFGLMTRSKAITYDNLALRAPDFVRMTDKVVARDVEALGFDVSEPARRDRRQLPLGEARIAGAQELSGEAGTVSVQLSDGSVLVFRHKYLVSYPNDQRLITPELEYPYGETPLAFMAGAGERFALREEGDTLLMAGVDAGNQLHLRAYEKQESLLGDVSFNVAAESTFTAPVKADLLLIEPLLSWLYVIDREQGGRERLAAKGFIPVEPPYMLRREAIEGAVDLSDFQEVIYKIEGEDLYLVGTSEVPLAAYHSDEILDGATFPLRYAAFSPCFRKEAGSHGKDTKGIIRVHWFDKVEMFIYATLEDAAAEHERLLAWEKEFLDKLELAYRVVDIAAGDLGASAIRKFDCEAWIPTQGKYRELTSTSNCTDFQTRRLETRGRFGDGTGPIATLNGTLTAITRAIVAILETHQQADGSVRVPAALRPFMGGLEVLEPVAR